jgi:acyl-CoA thioester hydrolase
MLELTYAVTVFPHHTDYGGVVWHGAYLRWLEEARVVWLAEAGVDYAQLVAQGIELPVVEMSVRYYRPAHLGDLLLVTAKSQRQGVRLLWQYHIQRQAELCLSAQVTLVPVARAGGKIVRRLPISLEQAIAKMTQSS